MKVAVIISIVSLSNSDILNSKWQIVTLLLSFIKFLIRAASENFRSACCLNSTINIFLDVSSQSSNLKGCQDDGPRVECDQGNPKAPIRQSGSSLPRSEHLSNWSSHHLDSRSEVSELD